MNRTQKYTYRLCSNRVCRFRYPDSAGLEKNAKCPRCGSMSLNVGEVQSLPLTDSHPIRRTQLIVAPFLDNIRSSYNVGSIFRTADGAGIKHLYLGGITPTPEHPKVAKTALGADRVVSWTYFRNGVEAVQDLKEQGWLLWSLEGGSQSQPLFQLAGVTPIQPILLIIGNERAGVDPGILELSDRVLSLPMSGHKHSLNVSVAFGVAAYWLCYGHNIIGREND